VGRAKDPGRETQVHVRRDMDREGHPARASRTRRPLAQTTFDVLWVTDDVMKVRIEHLHPPERAWIEKNLAGP
jgi:hypothetical protein